MQGAWPTKLRKFFCRCSKRKNWISIYDVLEHDIRAYEQCVQQFCVKNMIPCDNRRLIFSFFFFQFKCNDHSTTHKLRRRSLLSTEEKTAVSFHKTDFLIFLVIRLLLLDAGGVNILSCRSSL